MSLLAMTHPTPARAPARSLVPHEHGAYGQLFVPLAAGLVLARFSPLALTVAASASALFFAHEPALVLLGHRGARALAENRSRAWRRFTLLGALGLAAGAAAVLLGSRPLREALLAPVALGAPVVVLLLRRQEKTTAGEILAASALAAWAWPISVAGGLASASGALVAAVFAAAFASATLAVRVVIARAKRRPAGALRLASLAVFVGGAAALAFSPRPLAALALVPAGLLSVTVALAHPRPQRLREIGWSVVAASLVTAVVVSVIFFGAVA